MLDSALEARSRGDHSIGGSVPIGSDWAPRDSLVSIINAQHVKGAIIETGFSTCENVGISHNEIRQQTWINNALPIIKSKVAAQYSSQYNQRIVLLDWDTLKDNGIPNAFCDPWISLLGGPFDWGTENNFGIARLTYVPKIGCADLKVQLSGFPYR